MGIGPFSSSCFTDEVTVKKKNKVVKMSNPNILNWHIIRKEKFKNGYVIEVKYIDCTSYEGLKILVYEGEYIYQEKLDPHFRYTGHSPIARFRPDRKGWDRAIHLAKNLKE